MNDAATGAPGAPKTRVPGKSGKPKKKAAPKETKTRPKGAKPKEPTPLFGKAVPSDDYDEAARALHHQLRKLNMVAQRDDVPLSAASSEHFERVYDLVDEVLYSLGLRTTSK